MNIDWLQVITTILLVIAGFLFEYFKTKTKLIDRAKDAVVYAEHTYNSYTKAGEQKFQWAISYIAGLVPGPLKLIFTEELLGTIIQSAFDCMEKYAKQQLDKVVDKVVCE